MLQTWGKFTSKETQAQKDTAFYHISCSIIAVAVFVAVGSRMIRSGDGRTNKYDVEAGNNTYDNAVIENSKISEKNKIQNNQSMLDDIMNSTQYPKQLKDLALKNEEALEFVYDYPAEHVKEHTIDLTEEASMDSVPLFVQWDKRWGYENIAAISLQQADAVPLHFRW